MHHIVICGFSVSSVFLHITLYMAWFLEKSYWT